MIAPLILIFGIGCSWPDLTCRPHFALWPVFAGVPPAVVP